MATWSLHLTDGVIPVGGAFGHPLERPHPGYRIHRQVQAMDRAEDRLAHPTIRADDWPYPRSVIAGTDAFVCRDLAGLRGGTGDVMRFLWNGNGTLPAPLGP